MCAIIHTKLLIETNELHMQRAVGLLLPTELVLCCFNSKTYIELQLYCHVCVHVVYCTAGRERFFALLHRMTGTWGKDSRKSFKVSGKRLLPSIKMEMKSMVGKLTEMYFSHALIMKVLMLQKFRLPCEPLRCP